MTKETAVFNFNQRLQNRIWSRSCFARSDITYLENSVNGSIYHSISNDYVVSLKTGINTINAIGDDDIKLSDRKF